MIHTNLVKGTKTLILKHSLCHGTGGSLAQLNSHLPTTENNQTNGIKHKIETSKNENPANQNNITFPKIPIQSQI